MKPFPPSVKALSCMAAAVFAAGHLYFPAAILTRSAEAADAALNATGSAKTTLTTAADPDSDADGMSDQWEVRYGLEPRNPFDAAQDPDGDRLTNLQEMLAGTDPKSSDSDGDGLSDFIELMIQGTNPLAKDSDSDGMPDSWEASFGLNPRINDAGEDLDLDLITNLDEFKQNRDPSKPDNYESLVGLRSSKNYYDLNDRLIRVDYSNGFSIGYRYNGNGDLIHQVHAARMSVEGLPNIWKMLYGLTNSTFDHGPFGDPDNDGFPNYQEWKAASDPLIRNNTGDRFINTAPLARLLAEPSEGRSLATNEVRIWDGEANSALVQLQFLNPASSTWADATLVLANGKGPGYVPALPTGSVCQIVWNARQALGPSFKGSVLLRVRATEAKLLGEWSSAIRYQIDTSNLPPTISAIPDQITEPNREKIVEFTVMDLETPLDKLTITRGTPDPILLPEGNIVISGNGANRIARITPELNKTGSTSVTITVTDEAGLTASAVFRFSVVASNTPPTISQIPDQQTQVNKDTDLIVFTIRDAETLLPDLAATGKSDNPGLIPNANIQIGGYDSNAPNNRMMVIRPSPDQRGTANITITVTDTGKAASSTTFKITVLGEPPFISLIPDQTIPKNGTTGLIVFSVADKETFPGFLAITKSSSDTGFVPLGNIVLGGSGTNRTLLVTPVSDRTGSTIVTLTVTDTDAQTASSRFVVKTQGLSGDDFDGDSLLDLLFQDLDGFLAFWSIDGATLKSSDYLNPKNVTDKNYRLAGTGDFNGDGKMDLLFQHSDGTLAVWLMDRTRMTSAVFLNPSNPGDRNWKVVGTGDINRDGKVDLVFQHTDGTLVVWYMNGTALSSSTLISPKTPGDVNWKLVGVADLTSDGNQDLIFQHTDATLASWALDGAKLKEGGALLLNPSRPDDARWRVVAVSDHRKGGDVDIFFQHADGSLVVWHMNQVILRQAEILKPAKPGGTWKILAPR
jgi:hypothetical protein